jgi:hypothetical protein
MTTLQEEEIRTRGRAELDVRAETMEPDQDDMDSDSDDTDADDTDADDTDSTDVDTDTEDPS